ncbi:MAG: HNH endonuclease signature motif containing protein [Minisyncoccia bacterium]
MKGFYIDKKGYPRWKISRTLVHRTVARNKVGGKIFAGMVVHHIDGNKRNFRKSNLWIMSRSAHSRLHALKRMVNFH